LGEGNPSSLLCSPISHEGRTSPLPPPLHLRPAPLVLSTPLLHQVLQKTRNFFSRPFFRLFYTLFIDYPSDGLLLETSLLHGFLCYPICLQALYNRNRLHRMVHYQSHPECCPRVRSRRVRGLGGEPVCLDPSSFLRRSSTSIITG